VIARITCELACTPQELWERIAQPTALQYVAAPLITFKPLDPAVLEGPWTVGQVYPLTIALFGIVPLGRHDITVEVIDREQNLIVSKESGLLAKSWNHTISFQPIDSHTLTYTDEVEIIAGLLTPLIWSFAHIFYRHRQRRWKQLLQMDPDLLKGSAS
jgi:hypothetical protein